MYNCLYYSAAEHLARFEHGWVGLSQIIPYCIRPEPDEDLTLTFLNVNSASYTFSELRLKQITSEQLVEWSASIDLVENYEMYLRNSNELSANETFHNCSRPWFGQFCQFKFDEDRSFNDMVKMTFFSKEMHASYVLEVTNHTCYIHLNCSTGLDPICLDWRDICDGKTDCMNSNIDERDCYELEINICSEDEFQCHNGQCIHMIFFQDDPYNPDCLDGTDEEGELQCVADPTIRCEDNRRRYANNRLYHRFIFNCGDGESAGMGVTEGCGNKRSNLFYQTMLSKVNNPLLSLECWSLLIHFFQLNNYVNHPKNTNSFCYHADSHCIKFIFSACQSFFIFPSTPLLFGHVYLYYFLNRSNINDSLTFVDFTKSMYVCYDRQLCPFMPWTIKINGSTCRSFNELNVTCKWYTIVGNLANIFFSCSDNGINVEHCKNDGFFQCEKSNKCIPHRRLADGFADCYDNSDERTNKSCYVNDNSRFYCTSEEKCISYLIAFDTLKDCSDGEDTIVIDYRPESTPISFGIICDGFIEINLDAYTRNHAIETDETNCDYWPCNNLYTRCDGFWNCRNGSDELNCSDLSHRCPKNEFKCISPETFNLTCLSAKFIDDGNVDCLGGADERFYCRSENLIQPHVRYRCWNSTECNNVYSLCAISEWCPFPDIDIFCDNIDFFNDICVNYISYPELERHPVFEAACELDETLKKIKTVYFSLTEQSHHSVIIRLEKSEEDAVSVIDQDDETENIEVAWLCNRGLFIWHLIEEEILNKYCFCPPAYYGHRCQFQNQRISLSYRVYTVELRVVFNLVIMLIDNTSQIHSQEQRSYLPFKDCDVQFGMNLLYSTQPKDSSKKYIVRIDLFEKLNLNYRFSWEFPIQFSFLPVYRIATLLKISSESSISSQNCFPKCIHGDCLLYLNTQRSFCRCFHGWFGLACENAHDCNCADGSFCLGPSNNNTICVCSLGKCGPRCLLTRSLCQPNPCFNDGLCVSEDERIAENDFLCICKQGYTGAKCDHKQSIIEISFSDVGIPQSVLIHFITVVINEPSLKTTMMKRIAFDQDSITVYQSLEYHLIFLQFYSSYYLIYVEPKFTYPDILNLLVSKSDYCPSVNTLLNSTIMALSFLGRIKYYHVVCRQHIHLKCFYDEIYLCICSNQRHANCIEFEHNRTYDCNKLNDCGNDGQCFHDHPDCPSTTICVCNECFFGSRCQFNTKKFGLSLDVILGYQIRPHISLRKQSLAIQACITVTMVMFVVGLINGTLSIMTFQSTKAREVGCGLYLLSSSIISIFITFVHTLKFWHVILAQQKTITNRSYLSFNCVTMDIFLQVLLNSSEWLNVAVFVERAFTVTKGVHFDKDKTKFIAKIMIPVLIIVTTLTHIQDPLNRQLIADNEEQRTWRIVKYSKNVELFNSIVKFFHFFTPFALNFGSAVVVIISLSRTRFVAKKQTAYTEHLREQLHQHRRLLISPIILITLHLPRLVISLMSGCMKSARNPWIYLIIYFISYVPSLLTFIIFVLFSEAYKKEFSNIVSEKYIAIRRLCGRQ